MDVDGRTAVRGSGYDQLLRYTQISTSILCNGPCLPSSIPGFYNPKKANGRKTGFQPSTSRITICKPSQEGDALVGGA